MNFIRKQINFTGDTFISGDEILVNNTDYQFIVPLYQTVTSSGLYSQVQLGEGIIAESMSSNTLSNSFIPPNASGSNSSYGGISLQLQGQTDSKLEEIRTFGGRFLVATGETDDGLINQSGLPLIYPVIYRYEGITFTDITSAETIFTISNSGIQPDDIFYDPLIPSVYSNFAFVPNSDIDVDLVRDNSSVFDIYKKIEYVDSISNIEFYRITSIFSDI